MLQKLEDHIKACLKRGADAERRAAEVTDPNLKADSLALAAQWTHLARSYEFSESLERFLLDFPKGQGRAATSAARIKPTAVNASPSPNRHVVTWTQNKEGGRHVGGGEDSRTGDTLARAGT